MKLLPPMEKCPVEFYQGVVFTTKFDKSIPSATRDEEICQSQLMMSLPSEVEYPMEPFEWGLPVVQICCF